VSSTLKKYLPSCVIADGLIHVITEQISPGVIHRKSFTFYLQIACSIENINLKILEQLLNHCDLKTSTKRSLQYERWKKYLFTSTMSILTTYFDKPMGYIFKEKLALMLDILLEIQKVANAKNVNITSHDIEKTINQASHVVYETKTVMQIEFENKNKTEFDLLVGYVVKEAQSLNISIPNMQKIYDSLNSRLA
jgi:2-dehydropantoate 2-reductase